MKCTVCGSEYAGLAGDVHDPYKCRASLAAQLRAARAALDSIWGMTFSSALNSFQVRDIVRGKARAPLEVITLPDAAAPAPMRAGAEGRFAEMSDGDGGNE
jgi:hypothetical protein